VIRPLSVLKDGVWAMVSATFRGFWGAAQADTRTVSAAHKAARRARAKDLEVSMVKVSG
jgi:hypothetical protein